MQTGCDKHGPFAFKRQHTMELNPQKTAFLFPGQGSQKIGMGFELSNQNPEAKTAFLEADHCLGFSLSTLTWQGPDGDLHDTFNTQPALLTHSFAAIKVFEKSFPGFRPQFVAGHSMGELSALVAAGSLSFFDGLKLARKRGELMKEAGLRSPGGMAAIMGLDIPALEKICEQASSQTDLVQVANDNCPGQVVVSGSVKALEIAIQLAQEAGARKVTPLSVSIASHSPLMGFAQEKFNLVVNTSPITSPEITIIGNVDARPLTTPNEIRHDLQSQLTSRVRWTETIQFLIEQGVTYFIELGSGSVLTGLLKRINREVSGYALGSPDDFEKFFSGEV
jgi:[acyl-carrier-protein] S-malonyltransferase